MTAEITIPEGYKADAKGRLVPIDTIRPTDLLEDQLVEKCMEYAAELSAQIKRFKGHTYDDIAAHLALVAEKYGKPKGGQKGNMTFISFDGCAKVQVQVQDHINFGPELQIAKGLIDECIAEWAEDSRDEIRALVNHAFQVDKPGQVNREALFALRRIEIQDERWKKAVEAITDSIRVTGSKSYVRFYHRPTPQDRWKAVTIDMAAA